MRPDFVSGIDGHWSRRVVQEKNEVDAKFATEYLEVCFPLADELFADERETSAGGGVGLSLVLSPSLSLSRSLTGRRHS